MFMVHWLTLLLIYAASSEQNGKDQEAISEQPIGNTSDKSALGLQIKKGELQILSQRVFI